MGAVQCAGESYAEFAKTTFLENDTPEKLAAFAEQHFPEDEELRATIARERIVGKTLLECADDVAVDYVRGCSPKFRSWLAHLRNAEDDVEGTCLGGAAEKDVVSSQPAAPSPEDWPAPELAAATAEV